MWFPPRCLATSPGEPKLRGPSHQGPIWLPTSQATWPLLSAVSFSWEMRSDCLLQGAGIRGHGRGSVGSSFLWGPSDTDWRTGVLNFLSSFGDLSRAWLLGDTGGRSPDQSSRHIRSTHRDAGDSENSAGRGRVPHRLGISWYPHPLRQLGPEPPNPPPPLPARAPTRTVTGGEGRWYL